MKKAWTIIAVICIIAGCIIGQFSKIAIADYGAIALEAFGLVSLIIIRVSFCNCRSLLRSCRYGRSYNDPDYNYSCGAHCAYYRPYNY